MESSIWFNDLTVIDFSVITADGRILGNSATLNLELSGPVDAHEGVVVDFSAGKKIIKELIDGFGGFDHKCWINLDDPDIVLHLDETATTVTHRRSGLSITAERDAFAWVSNNPQADIADFLNTALAPLVVSNVTLNTSVIPVPHSTSEPHTFKYVHGLKNSSSYGCKNIVHGHKSFIAATVAEGFQSSAHYVLKAIASDLDECIFVHAEDLKSTEGGVYKVGYSTDERGQMSMQFTQKLFVLETQTTVEHIVEFVRARYYDNLKAAGILELFVSEGLCKGAKVTV